MRSVFVFERNAYGRQVDSFETDLDVRGYGTLVETESYDISTAGPDAQSGRRLAYAFQYNLRTDDVAPRTDDPQESTARRDASPGLARPSRPSTPEEWPISTISLPTASGR